MERKKIVILGDILYDCFVWAPKLPAKGETVMGYANGFFSGGKGANQAVQAARLGAEVWLIGKTGNDEHGNYLRKELEGYGVNTKYVFMDKNTATGTCCVHVDQKGDNAIIVAPLANLELEKEELQEAKNLIQKADIFMAQLLSKDTIISPCLDWATEAGVTSILNPAPARNIPDGFFHQFTFFSPNETEAEFFTDSGCESNRDKDWCRRMAGRLGKKGIQSFMMTMGEQGVYFRNQSEEHLVPCYKVKAKDSTGAGDSFNAAFAVAYAYGKRIEGCLHFASAASALTVQAHGSQPAMPDLEQVNQFLTEMGEERYTLWI